ncbi:MAG: PDZ domain-containing protein [Firmicutes bacterium]|nr:PDZ domain-containing protein [Bacillota bacterium]
MDEFLEPKNQSKGLGFGRQLTLVVAGAVLGCIFTVMLLPSIVPRLVPSPQEYFISPGDAQRDQAELYEHQRTSVVDAVGQVSPAVVGVTRFSRSREFFNPGGSLVPAGTGSGVVFNPEGYIVTNYHVVEDAAGVLVTLADGAEFEAEIIGSDPGTDLAVLKIEPEEPLPAAVFGDSDQLVVGEYAIAIGNPGGLELQQTVSLGVISAKERNIEVYDWVFGLLQTDAAINPGNSGGPLVNARGEVIGINSVKLIDAEGLGFAIPSNLVQDVVGELLERGRVVRPMLGVNIIELNPSIANRYNLPLDSGIYVAEVFDNGPAWRAGIRSEDVIVSIDGSDVNTIRDLRVALSRRSVGDMVEVTINRADEIINLDVRLEDLAD